MRRLDGLRRVPARTKKDERGIEHKLDERWRVPINRTRVVACTHQSHTSRGDSTDYPYLVNLLLQLLVLEKDVPLRVLDR